MLTTFVCAHNFKINRNISVPRRVLLPPACCSSFVIIVIHVLLANIQIAGNQWLPTRAVNRLPYNPCAHLHPLHPHIYPCSAPSLAYLWRVLLSVLFFSAVVDWKLYALLSIKAVPICTVRHKSWLCLLCRCRLSLLVLLGYRLAISLSIYLYGDGPVVLSTSLTKQMCLLPAYWGRTKTRD